MGTRTCAGCGRPATADQNFCSNCGAALAPPPPPATISPAPAVAPEPESYQSGMTLGAVLLSIFAPFAALIVALIMRGSETNPVKRAFLKTWAIASGALVALYFIVTVSIFAAIAASGPHVSTNGPCFGGPILNQPGVQVGPHKYRFACEGGGSTVVNLP